MNKINKSKLSGCSAENVYVPTLWYFRELHFLGDRSLKGMLEEY